MSEKQYVRLVKGFDVGLKFKGIWMSKEIVFAEKTSLIDKVILAIVQGFQKGNKDCFMSNQALADICSCKPRAISRAISKMKAAGVIPSRYKVINAQAKRILWV